MSREAWFYSDYLWRLFDLVQEPFNNPSPFRTTICCQSVHLQIMGDKTVSKKQRKINDHNITPTHQIH